MSKKAHQRVVRESRASSESHDLFGEWWPKNPNISAAFVREISVADAARVIKAYEWLGTMPAVVVQCFGIFFDGCLGGAVVFSPEYTENLGVWDRYGFTGKIVCLSRGACAHWAHPHAGSKLVRTAISLLPKRYEVVTCTVDETAGEVGTIYQACGFTYVGVMSAGGTRASVIANDGSRISARHAYREHGTRGVRGLSAAGLCVESVPRKGRYFCFRGSTPARKRHAAAISHLVKPYPKRTRACNGADSKPAAH